jgi:transposase-like protein
MLRGEQLAADDPLYEAATTAHDNAESWRAFEELAQARWPRIKRLTNWLRRNGNTITVQFAHPHRPPIINTGPLEAYFSELRNKLNDRRGGLSNRERLDRMLMLMMLHQRAAHSAADHAHIIREYLTNNSGRAGRRRQIDDRRGHPSL